MARWASSQSADPAVANGAAPDVASTLAELRARMDAIKASVSGPPQVARAESGLGAELPFFQEHAGSVHARRRDHGPAPRVGALEMSNAQEVDAQLLALLAVDPRIASCDFSRALYIDTETTGLSRGAGTVAFLIGVAYWSAGRLCTELLFVPNYGEERASLCRMLELVEAADLLVSFNGKAFDLPLLRTRLVMAGLGPLPERPHLDLLAVARRVHKRADGTRRGVRLQELERDVLGLVRHGDIPSSEVSAVYNHYVRTGDVEGLREVADHNEQDVLSMVALVALYGEPLAETRLRSDDLAGVARWMARHGDKEQALALANVAVTSAPSAHALRARGEIAKARHLRDLALEDFERAHLEASDARLRLELAKLYEHHRKDIARALAMVDAGVSEAPGSAAHRQARLTRKSRA